MHRLTVNFVLGTLLLAFAHAPEAEAANSGSGTFRMDKIKSTFASACGFRVANPETPRAAKSVVVLASVRLDCAALDVEGVDADGGKKRGRVYLVQEGGAWKFAGESLRMVFD